MQKISKNIFESVIENFKLTQFLLKRRKNYFKLDTIIVVYVSYVNK